MLVITTALPLEPTRAILRRLLLVLACVSWGVLAVAALAGRTVCRRALPPVRRMAADARAVDPDDPDRRIVTPTGGDELTDLGLAFNGLLDRLHESSERHRRFTGDASHQLRTPLAALLGQIEIALRRDRSAEEYRGVLTTAHSKATHLQRIIESLLYLTRADSEANIPNREPHDLSVWLVESVAIWSDHARFPDVRVVGVERPTVVTSHPVLLGEIVHILLDNACRYSPAGNEITLTLNRVDGAVWLEIGDRGPGISDGDLAHIFTPFFRTTGFLRANRGGIGLGLSIARRLAEALGASLGVTSRADHGSCFVLTFSTAETENERNCVAPTRPI